MTEFKKRPSLEQIVRELVHPYVVDGRRRAPLLSDVSAMVMPSQQMIRDGAGSMGKRVGSPAPWFAPAAELIDEVLRGAMRWESEACHTLGLELRPGRTGTSSLLALPGLVELLADAGHPLGVKASAGGVVSDGLIEQDVRRWHSRARVLVGDEKPVERLPTVANPDHPSNGGRRRVGPTCRRCSHRSCERIKAGHRRSLSWPCPECRCDSLRRDPLSDVVLCIRPSCVGEDGRRPSWHITLFDEAALDPWGDTDAED